MCSPKLVIIENEDMIKMIKLRFLRILMFLVRVLVCVNIMCGFSFKFILDFSSNMYGEGVSYLSLTKKRLKTQIGNYRVEPNSSSIILGSNSSRVLLSFSFLVYIFIALNYIIALDIYIYIYI